MGVDSHIVDPVTGTALALTHKGHVQVEIHPPTPEDLTKGEVHQKRSLVSLLATSAGSTDLAVDGSGGITYKVTATDNALRWIAQVRLVIHSTQANIANVESRRFGAAASSPGLTNGITFTSKQGGTETDFFTTAVKNIGDFERYADPTGRGIVSNVDAVAAGTDLLVVTITLPVPVGLFPGSLDCVCLTINDDLSALDLFEAVAMGWQEPYDSNGG